MAQLPFDYTSTNPGIGLGHNTFSQRDSITFHQLLSEISRTQQAVITSQPHVSSLSLVSNEAPIPGDMVVIPIPNIPTNRTWLSVCTMKNALIATVGIGNYDSDVFPDLIDISKDYFNIIHCFHESHGYDCVYFNKQNKLVHLSQAHPISIQNWDMDFKLRWICDEIDNFLNQVFTMIQNQTSAQQYDGLIFFVSSHGGADNVI